MKGSRNFNGNPGKEKQVDVSLMHPDSVKNYNHTLRNKVPTQNELPATPAGGWDNFEKYLRENKRHALPPSGETEVLLGFSVGPLGKPINIRVIKGLTEEFNQEAIRLLNEGPKWEYQGKQEIRVKIDFTKN